MLFYAILMFRPVVFYAILMFRQSVFYAILMFRPSVFLLFCSVHICCNHILYPLYDCPISIFKRVLDYMLWVKLVLRWVKLEMVFTKIYILCRLSFNQFSAWLAFYLSFFCFCFFFQFLLFQFFSSSILIQMSFKFSTHTCTYILYMELLHFQIFQSKVLLHFCIVLLYCGTLSRPRHICNTTLWTFNSNQSINLHFI